MTKRRIICTLLSIVMIMSFLSVGTFASATTASDHTDAATHLINLGIMDSSFWQNGTAFMTRGEFAGLIYDVSGASSKYDTAVFNDVSIEDKYFDEISYCVYAGLMSGYEDGTFRPAQPISIIEAAKVFVVLAGYNSQAYYNGGYQYGYSIVARDIGLYDDINIYNENTFITRSALAQMTYNALICPYREGDKYDGKGNVHFVNTGETVAEHFLNVVGVTGIMYSNGIFAIDDVAVKEDRILVGDIELVCDRYDFMKYIGHSVKCFFDKDTMTVKSVTSDKNRTQALTINGFDISSIENNTIQYVNGDKIKKAKISNDAMYLLNGRNVLGYEIESLINRSEAELQLICNNGSGKYNIVLVNIYTEIVVGSRGINGKVVDLFDAEKFVVLDEENNENIRIVDDKGNLISYKDIAINDILSVIDDTEFIYVKVSKKSLNGILEMRSDNYITVDGEKYVYSENCRSSVEALPIGANIKIYINVSGMVTAVSANGNNLSKYGFLYKTAFNDNLTRELKLKVFTTDGKMEVYSAKSNIRIDDTVVKIDDLNDVPVQLQNVNCLIGFDVNEDGFITKIDLPSDTCEDSENAFYRAVNNRTLRYHSTNDIIGGNHIVGAKTIVMQVPVQEDFENEDLFMIYERSILDTSDYTVDIYYYSAMNEYCDVMVVHGVDSIGRPSYDSYIAVLSSINTVLDENGDVRQAAVYNSKNKLLTSYIPEKLKDVFADMEPGDVFRFVSNTQGYFTSAELIYDLSADTVVNVVGESWSEGARITKKYIAKVGPTTIRVSDTPASYTYNDSALFEQEIIPIGTPFITVVERDGAIIREGTADEILVDSKVVFYQRSTTLKAIVIYND